MTKKRIIAYALAITSLFGVYKGCHKLGEHIRENYLNESFSDSTLNNETTINETLSAIIPTETTIIPETISFCIFFKLTFFNMHRPLIRFR